MQSYPSFIINESFSVFSFSVNFKKNEKAYDSTGSEVLKFLKESENDPAEPGMCARRFSQVPTFLFIVPYSFVFKFECFDPNCMSMFKTKLNLIQIYVTK